jgi:hypothetical protein
MFQVRYQWNHVLVLVLLLTLAGPLSAEDTKRGSIKGEVADTVAFVQTLDTKANASFCHIEARIKFVKAGTYTVAGGYYKGEFFHEGALGKKFFETKTIKADAGDIITVKFKAPVPPSNKKVTVAVFKSAKDIRTKS